MADAVHMIAGRSFGRRATHCGEELANIATTPRPTPADSSLGGHAATKPRPDLPTVTLNRPVVTMTTVASRYRWEERNLSYRCTVCRQLWCHSHVMSLLDWCLSLALSTRPVYTAASSTKGQIIVINQLLATPETRVAK